MKEEALKLADEWDWMTEEKLAKWGDDVQAMIRRLVEELDKQWYMVNKDGYVKPLSDEEIWKLHDKHIDWIPCGHSEKVIGFVEFARAIEERHGIK